MGIDLELHSSRPARNNWRKSRATLLRSSCGHGDALADALGSLQLLGVPGRLTAVDPYGDTLMNEQEAGAALQEIHGLRRSCADERQLLRWTISQRCWNSARLPQAATCGSQATEAPASLPCECLTG
jgi:hypothetical protein